MQLITAVFRGEGITARFWEDIVYSGLICLIRFISRVYAMHLHQASVYLDSIADYKKNTYTLTEEVRAKVSQRWRFFFERYGYLLLPSLDPGASVPLG